MLTFASLMRKLIVIILLLIILGSCTSTKYIEIPVPKVKIEYRNHTSTDTLIQNDSIIIKEKSDTVFIEKYKYLYKSSGVVDTVNITDTITIVKTVEVTKETNRLHNWQIILIILGVLKVISVGYRFLKL